MVWYSRSGVRCHAIATTSGGGAEPIDQTSGNWQRRTLKPNAERLTWHPVPTIFASVSVGLHMARHVGLAPPARDKLSTEVHSAVPHDLLKATSSSEA